ncbi:MerR family transcriptional regulator [Cohnella nanjingensis]|uniref:MerR family transcriptional regulator n=1 Tax=Cohnella nanjingensis TaxID=1387779 RepID=A0A7X0RTB4_9BACL|nr:MerR family transcriptional regulator [Cohnella nanjingensis]MBB6673317.1 MerR family transcriptional regulator [Cohnella nanjingensis]
MKISELSKITGVSARSIRHYEKKKLIAPTRLENDYREFNEAAIERIKSIKIYLGLGLTTEEIGELLSCHDPEPEPDMDEYCDEMLEVYEQKWAELNGQIKTLASVQHRLESQINEMKTLRDRQNADQAKEVRSD